MGIRIIQLGTPRAGGEPADRHGAAAAAPPKAEIRVAQLL